MPNTLSFDEAACCPTVCITTTLVTRAALITPHSRVLVHGAAGGVGLAALQQIQALQVLCMLSLHTYAHCYGQYLCAVTC